MYCEQLSSTFENVAQEFTDVKFLAVDLRQVPKLKDMENIEGVPCVIFFRNLKKVLSVVGGETLAESMLIEGIRRYCNCVRRPTLQVGMERDTGFDLTERTASDNNSSSMTHHNTCSKASVGFKEMLSVVNIPRTTRKPRIRAVMSAIVAGGWVCALKEEPTSFVLITLVPHCFVFVLFVVVFKGIVIIGCSVCGCALVDLISI
jgi:thiol-disulfide isomerase/thioredoxin